LAIPAESHAVTGLLKAWSHGDAQALNELMPLVHEELHRIAVRCLSGERRDHTLQATALVNEAYLRLVDVHAIDWQNRAHFLAMAARLMRRVLVDLARAKRADKRSGDLVHVTFDEDLVHDAAAHRDLLRLNDALQALTTRDERKGKVVELRYFGGLSVEETAAVLGVSTKTVQRDWDFALAWLQREMAGESAT
jgi:RNA polymerase sigma factor (TIGR02999 family)